MGAGRLHRERQPRSLRLRHSPHPGRARRHRTGFASALHYTTETAAYRDNAAGRTRRYLETADDSVFAGDPAKLAAAIYDTTRHPNPPLRLILGSDTYDPIHTALTERLTALETQKDLAASVAFNR